MSKLRYYAIKLAEYTLSMVSTVAIAIVALKIIFSIIPKPSPLGLILIIIVTVALSSAVNQYMQRKERG